MREKAKFDISKSTRLDALIDKAKKQNENTKTIVLELDGSIRPFKNVYLEYKYI